MTQVEFPLIGHADPAAPLAFGARSAIPASRFLADALGLAEALRPARGVLNLCSDRYRFAVTFAATVVAGRTNLLPADQTPRTLEQVAEAHPGCVAVADVPVEGCPVALEPFESICRPAPGTHAVPTIPAEHVAALVFTSGSTGAPKPNFKRWGRLVTGSLAEAQALGLGLGVRFNVVGTVPSQHMYGLESVVLMALHGGGTFHVERPLFPRDVQMALERLPEPRVLVTTPIHIRALLEDRVRFPPLAVVVSAAAPLPLDLAREAERRFGGTPVLEIYGFTEAGMVASRRTTQTTRWRTLPGVRLVKQEGRYAFTGGNVHGAVPAGDLLEVSGETEFDLVGRHEDLVNVAGKRASLADLNRKLGEIAGVKDGVFHIPTASDRRVDRLMAFVVAPTLSESEIIDALRQRIDAAFLPRPLVKLESLPRAATGKLSLAALRELEAEASARLHSSP